MAVPADPTTGRGPLFASLGLALAILVIGGLAAWTLVSPPAVSTTSDATPAPATAPAPSSPAPAAGVPGLVDTDGGPLPPPVAAGVQEIYTTMSAGDLATLRGRYAPDRRIGAAPWAQVAPVLVDPAARERLLAALRTAPDRRSTRSFVYSAGADRVGVDGQGRMSFVLVG